MRNRKHFNSKNSTYVLVVLFFMLLLWSNFSIAAPAGPEEIEKHVKKWMEDGDIPGLSLVIVKGDEPVYTKGFGYSDVAQQKPVTPGTLFELCSTSKAFTALAMLKCEADGLVNLDAPVSNYLPWFYAVYKGEKRKITVRQFLHQTSGIPFNSVARIPASSATDALEQTVRNLVGIKLATEPGTRFQYATINYDVLGAVIEKATGMAYEDYILKNVLRPLGLTNTLVGREQLTGVAGEVAEGHKIGFFKAREYSAPAYRGNNPAGYIISNGVDVARWLRLQLGLEGSDFTPLMLRTQQRDPSVSPDSTTMLAYGMGWMPALDGSGLIQHSGQNPNFTAHMVFHPEKKIGVAVLSNSNSNYTPYIANSVMSLLTGAPLPSDANLGDGMDKSSSVISFVLALYLLFSVAFFIWVILDLLKGRRKFQPLSIKTLGRLAGSLVMLVPFAIGVYLLPYVTANVPWKTALVWAPNSLKFAALMIFLSMGVSYLGYIFSTLFPQQNKYLRSLPFLILISLLSGGANAAVIFLLSMSLYSNIKLGYLLFYFGLAAILYLVGRKVLSARLVKIAFGIIYDLRMRLIERIFSTSYQRYEKLDSGRVIATLNNDTTQLGGVANVFVAILSSLITVLGAFLYLFAIAFWSTLVTISVIIAVATVYSIVSQKAAQLFNEARNTQNDYLGLLNGLNDGFKELSLHSSKKAAYKNDIKEVTEKFRDTSSDAMIRFVNAFMIGESMLIMVLGAVGFGIPYILPDIKTSILMSFVMVLLYLIGPVTAILNSIPQFVQMKIAWERIQGLQKDIPANIEETGKALLAAEVREVQDIKADGVFFEYESEDENEKFSVGPLDFHAKKGEIVFVIGGNGSGKTTLAKLLTGLYIPHKGSITIDGKEVNNEQLGEFFSVVFGDFHLFEKLYDVDMDGKDEEIKEYLEMLRLQEKVSVENNSFSTIELSGGQRKRLALLRCYLEDRPIYLFDEIAADQDPEFRKFFYRDLLVKMRERGKMVIAITHDDHYFDVADRVIKMDMGRVDIIGGGATLNVTK